MPSPVVPGPDNLPPGPPTGPSWLHGPPPAAPYDQDTPPQGHPAPPMAPPAAPPAWRPPSASPGMAPPMSPPAPPPAWRPPSGAAGAPEPAGSPRGASSRRGVAVVVALALLIGALAGGATSHLLGLSGSPASLATAPRRSTTQPTDPSAADPGAGGGSSSSGGSSGSGSGLSTAEVAAAIDPGVVDIESRLPMGVGAGTGMVLTDTGEVLTNNHVIDGATKIQVTVTATGKTYGATVVGADPTHDVAVLQIRNATGLTTIPLGDSDTVQVGDDVVAIGNAGGQGGEPSVAPGQVVDLHQQITASDESGTNAETLTDLIQVDANVVPGDSGGPLANTSGQVIGMDTAAANAAAGRGGARFRTAGNVAFAIPINTALRIAKQLESGSSVDNSVPGTQAAPGGAFLGVQVDDGTVPGAEIVGVEAGSPAEDGGLTAGDVIVKVDGTTVQSADDLVAVLEAHQPGDRVAVSWIDSGGATHNVTVTLADA